MTIIEQLRNRRRKALIQRIRDDPDTAKRDMRVGTHFCNRGGFHVHGRCVKALTESRFLHWLANHVRACEYAALSWEGDTWPNVACLVNDFCRSDDVTDT